MADLAAEIRADRVRDETVGCAVTEYGVRYSWGEGTHITNYGTDRAEAERDAKHRPCKGQTIELVRRKVVVSPWEEAGDAAPDH